MNLSDFRSDQPPATPPRPHDELTLGVEGCELEWPHPVTLAQRLACRAVAAFALGAPVPSEPAAPVPSEPAA